MAGNFKKRKKIRRKIQKLKNWEKIMAEKFKKQKKMAGKIKNLKT